MRGLPVTYELYQTVQTEMGSLDVKIFEKKFDPRDEEYIGRFEETTLSAKLKDGFFWIRVARERVAG